VPIADITNYPSLKHRRPPILSFGGFVSFSVRFVRFLFFLPESDLPIADVPNMPIADIAQPGTSRSFRIRFVSFSFRFVSVRLLSVRWFVFFFFLPESDLPIADAPNRPITDIAQPGTCLRSFRVRFVLFRFCFVSFSCSGVWPFLYLFCNS